MIKQQCQWTVRLLTALAGSILTFSAGCQPVTENTLGGFVGDFLRQLTAALLL